MLVDVQDEVVDDRLYLGVIELVDWAVDARVNVPLDALLAEHVVVHALRDSKHRIDSEVLRADAAAARSQTDLTAAANFVQNPAAAIFPFRLSDLIHHIDVISIDLHHNVFHENHNLLVELFVDRAEERPFRGGFYAFEAECVTHEAV